MEYLLGIDGGGSKTVALLADTDGHVLGRGTAGSANYQAVGAAAACAALDEAIRAAFADAGVIPQPAQALIVGLAGVDRAEDRTVFAAWAAERHPAGHATAVNDALLVLAAGTPSGWGLSMICGTGSIAYGRAPDGRLARAGGWGYLLGDEGSGYAIGLAGLRAVARAADGRAEQTKLTSLILDHWSLTTPQDLIRRTYRETRNNSEIAALAMLVDQAAAEGDSIAQAIIQSAGHELALAAHSVAVRLALPDPTPCALAGGLLVHGQRLAHAFVAEAQELGLAFEPVVPVPEPAEGAVLLARQSLSDHQ
jgi:N-acetylmuramic acid 6-phosphate etherase